MVADGSAVRGDGWRGASADGRWRLLAPAPRGPLSPGESPTFSVVIAAWQAASVVGDAVRSALAQTRPALEVIVCDDGSTDDLAGALAPFGDGIRLLSLRHAGEAATKNAGAQTARGDFVVYLDADDVFDPERLEAMAALAVARPDLDVLTTDAHLEVAGRAVRRCYIDAHPFELGDQRARILERNFVFGLAAARRSRLLEVGGFDEGVERTSDWGCWIRMLLTGSSVGLVDAPLARYRVREESLSADRAGMAEGAVATLEHAGALPALTGADRVALAEGLRRARARATLVGARSALAGGAPDVRRRLLALARSADHPMATRCKALLSAGMPRPVLGWLGRREAASAVGAGGTRLA